MTGRRPQPWRLLIALVLAVLAPVGVMTATGLSDAGGGGGVETAGRGAGEGGSGSDDDALVVRRGDDGGEGDRSGEDDEGGDRTTTTVAPSTASTAPPDTPATTAAPPTTTPPTTAPPAPPPTTTAGPPPAGAAIEIEGVVALANMARMEAGCPELRVDERLAAAAQGHSDDMAAKGYFSHESADGRTFADRVTAAGYPSPGGENIAQGQRSSLEVHESWLRSEGHRANILNCAFTTIGVGLHLETWTWTQAFGY